MNKADTVQNSLTKNYYQFLTSDRVDGDDFVDSSHHLRFLGKCDSFARECLPSPSLWTMFHCYDNVLDMYTAWRDLLDS